MKKILTSLLVTALWLVSALSSFAAKDVTVIVSPDHADWVYRVGETCHFSIRVVSDQNFLPGVKVDYELGPEFYMDQKGSGVTDKDGVLKVSGKMRVPGFFTCLATAEVAGHSYQGRANVGYEPEKIVALTRDPADFDEFWSRGLAAARKVDLKPRFELQTNLCTDKVNVYHVSFQDVRSGSRTYGMLAVPKAPGKYPALLRVPGAGVRPYGADVSFAEQGVITLQIGIHGVPVNMPAQVYQDLASGALSGYEAFNKDDHRKSYYYRVILECVRAVDFIYTLPEFDGKTVAVTGGSQGGALSLSTAGLDPRIKFYAAVYPALCDHRGHLAGRAGGWPHYFYRKWHDTKAEVADELDYYDMVNFARRIQCPGWFTYGYNDITCPPTSTYAAYNSVKAPKELHLYLDTGHFNVDEQVEQWNKWLLDQFKAYSGK